MKSLTISEMEKSVVGSGAHLDCVILMGVAVGIWTTAVGIASAGAGFALGVAGGVFTDWVCSR